MKQSLYRSAYRVVSWFSDKTGGWSFLVRWKVALAALVIGVSATTFTSCKPTCYEQVTCYDPVPTCYITPEEPCPEDGDGGKEESPTTFTQIDTGM